MILVSCIVLMRKKERVRKDCSYGYILGDDILEIAGNEDNP